MKPDFAVAGQKRKRKEKEKEIPQQMDRRSLPSRIWSCTHHMGQDVLKYSLCPQVLYFCTTNSVMRHASISA